MVTFYDKKKYQAKKSTFFQSSTNGKTYPHSLYTVHVFPFSIVFAVDQFLWKRISDSEKKLNTHNITDKEHMIHKKESLIHLQWAL